MAATDEQVDILYARLSELADELHLHAEELREIARQVRDEDDEDGDQ